MYFLRASGDGSVLADDFFSFGALGCGDGFSDAEMLADGKVKPGAGPLEGVDIAIVVDLLLVGNLNLSVDGLHGGPEARESEF